ncbi:MAG: type I methionyl aminopeptidase [Candidatus Omnitrophota bacterium]|jgi:methionyl aminopeptidase
MIVLRSEEEIVRIKEAGKIVAETLDTLKRSAKPGMRTDELDKIARDAIIKRGGIPAFKNYKGFPANICTSINETVVHGIPSARRLEEGDIISIDAGVKYKDYFADAAITVPVGKIAESAGRLIRITEESLAKGIEYAKPGNRLSDISSRIQEYVESNGYSVVRAFVGHGIGTKMHEEPEIPNYGRPGRGPRLEKGMVLAIEPMVNTGTYDVEILEDGWTVVTKDRGLSAHFEHTIAIRDEGAQILTGI